MQLFSDHFVCHMKEEKAGFRNAQYKQGNFLLIIRRGIGMHGSL